jgi:hypothetical protein
MLISPYTLTNNHRLILNLKQTCGKVRETETKTGENIT